MRQKKYHNQIENLQIEDKPRSIRFDLIYKQMKKYWKSGVFCLLVFGMISLTLSPSGGFSGYTAETTLYTPPSTRRKIDNRIYVISNNLNQLDNMVELIQSKLYRDAVAEKAGVDNLNKIGSFKVSRIDKTDLISIIAASSSRDEAEKLCKAVVSVMTEQLGKKVSINDMVSVDSVKSYSVSTPSSLTSSFVKGGLVGIAVWLLYILLRTFGDRRFHSAEEVENDLDLPVMTILPQTGNK